MLEDHHTDIAKILGVKSVTLGTTLCVAADLRNRSFLFSDDDGFKTSVLKCSAKMRLFDCEHHEKTVSPAVCLESVIETELSEPYILASIDRTFYSNIQQSTGVLVLTSDFLRKQINPSTSAQLERIKQRRIEAIELKQLKKSEKEALFGQGVDTSELYKGIYGHDATVRLLCDGSYLRYLGRMFSHKPELSHTMLEDYHANIAKIFGCKRITLDTTKCVLAELRIPGSFNVSFDEIDMALRCAMKLRQFHCQHFEKPVRSDVCLERTVGDERREPYTLASLDGSIFSKIQEKTGVLILTVVGGRKVIIPSTPAQLARVKQSRIELMEWEHLEKSEKEAEYKEYLAEQEKKKKETEDVAVFAKKDFTKGKAKKFREEEK